MLNSLFSGRPNTKVQARIDEVAGILEKIAARDFSQPVDINNSDAFVPLMRSVKKIQDADTESSRQVMIIEAALSSVRSCVMVADENLNIIYANPALVSMFKAAEDDFSEASPGFNANRILGANVDQFIDNPPQLRRILNELTGQYKTEIHIGKLVFSLMANPVFYADGRRRIATVIEWTNRSSEADFKAQINEVVDGVLMDDWLCAPIWITFRKGGVTAKPPKV
ncbi:PAS domain-containing protein [Candidatus Methylospira mobilis]|uniref:PAS domain-containing protein n=1 Tax=Candidatus Methylospira mobilis TaxID=1808979 RepID=UPI0028E976B1|nr:PAS domain-containing protein [Candidatus Methylospira mobilis]WNV05104.1 PAS domain-containing protein [Candidatus Methylospira mobilis]